MDWFPRPSQRKDLRVLPPSGRWSASEIFELLHDASAVEWRDKVGVVGRNDGSAKAGVRLLCIRGWVAKINLEQQYGSSKEAIEAAARLREPGLAARVWHPDKQWSVLQVGDAWVVLTLCPELRTLRKIEDIDERMEHWTKMLRMAVRVSRKCGMGMDLNPSNFGFRPEDPEHLYYIDEECYTSVVERDLAGAILARIPEEPEFGPSIWRGWSESIVRMLEQEFHQRESWKRINDELDRCPLTPLFDERKRAVMGVFFESFVELVNAERNRANKTQAAKELTFVFGDIHANLPALQAVLEVARELRVDSYLVLGDIVGYGPHPSECIEQIAALENSTLISGNHDYAIATGQFEMGMNQLARQVAQWTVSVLSEDEREWLGKLPKEHAEENWLAVHGAPKDPQKIFAYVYDLTYESNLQFLREKKISLCFCGHTHIPQVHAELPLGPMKLPATDVIETRKASPMIVNPGSVGQPRDGDFRAAFAVWDRKRGEIRFHRTQYDAKRTMQDLEAHRLPSRLVDRIRSGT